MMEMARREASQKERLLRALERGAAWTSHWMCGMQTSQRASSGIYGVGSRGRIVGDSMCGNCRCTPGA